MKPVSQSDYVTEFIKKCAFPPIIYNLKLVFVFGPIKSALREGKL